ncbi:MAG: helix-turn-helix domain-containing protein [Clostridia bacterium]|nr:helix-turn-helix domain-containing protein [Clostridia bacterium]
MVETAVYAKKLCMSELRVQRSLFRNSHYFDAGAGNANSSIGYVVKGSVELSMMGRHYHLDAGSLFYVPEGIRYNSIWRGCPEIEFYGLHIISHKPDPTAERYALQHIPALSTPETGDKIREIFELFATGDRVNKVRALGLYYTFYAGLLPYLETEAPQKYNPALISAINYIEAHYASDFSVDELAVACCVSESRLYHLFKSELRTTPVKYRNEYRIEKAAAALRHGTLSIDDVAETNGFNSAAYFRETFKDFTGLTPSEYRGMVQSPERQETYCHCI